MEKNAATPINWLIYRNVFDYIETELLSLFPYIKQYPHSGQFHSKLSSLFHSSILIPKFNSKVFSSSF